jgi:hypothetical protein
MRTRTRGLSERAAYYDPLRSPRFRRDARKYMLPALAVSGCRLVRGVMQGSATCDEFTPRSPHYGRAVPRLASRQICPLTATPPHSPGAISPPPQDRSCDRYAVPMPGMPSERARAGRLRFGAGCRFRGPIPTRPPREPRGCYLSASIKRGTEFGAPQTRAPDRRPQASVEAMRSDLTQVALAVGVRPRAMNG